MTTHDLSLETRKALWDIIKTLQTLVDELSLSPQDELFFREKIKELVVIRDKLMELQNAAAKETVANQAR